MESVVETAARDGVDALRARLLAQVIAQVAVQSLIDLRLRAKCKRYGLDVHGGHHGPDQAAIQREKVELTADHHLERRGVAAGQLIVLRKSLDLNASTRFGLDRGPQLNQALVERAIGRLVVVL